MKGQKGKIFRNLVLTLITAAALANGAAAVWHWINLPCVVRKDCRGKGIDVERIKALEEEEKDGALGILRIAGWRIEEEETVSSVSTGRKETTRIIGVYGAMELVEEAGIACGRYGLAAEEGYCVLSEALARELFGGTDVAGEWVRVGKEKLFVAGVIEKDEAVLLKPIEEGELEMVAVELDSRMGAKGRGRN